MNSNYNEINSCEVCGNQALESVLDLGFHPMCDDLVAVGDNRVCIEFPIEILFCKNCNTAHQRFQVPKEDLFPSSYHYRSRFTADVLNGMKNLVDSCSTRFGSLIGKKVLDIGCNDGSLLDLFRAKDAVTFGIEPTGACVDAIKKGHFSYNNYLSEELALEFVKDHGKPDFITFTNVFAHIEDLQGVLRALKVLTSDTTIIIIENHYLGSVLSGSQFDTFYHEHPRTYSFDSFKRMAATLGMPIAGVEFPARYGGNIRVFLGNSLQALHATDLDLVALAQRESGFFGDFTLLRKNIESWLITKREFLQEEFKRNGKLRVKAFPGRAAILVKLLDLNESLISAVYEKPGSLKIGHYLPGTRIPVHSDEELFALSDQSLPLLNLAWHIPLEIRTYLSEHGYSGNVHDIIDSHTFNI